MKKVRLPNQNIIISSFYCKDQFPDFICYAAFVLIQVLQDPALDPHLLVAVGFALRDCAIIIRRGGGGGAVKREGGHNVNTQP